MGTGLAWEPGPGVSEEVAVAGMGMGGVDEVCASARAGQNKEEASPYTIMGRLVTSPFQPSVQFCSHSS
jgi:hypothetical protein